MPGNPGHYCSFECRAQAPRTQGGRPDLFATWSPDEAWLAGLLWSDGCLVGGRTYERITLNVTDQEIAEVAGALAGRPVQMPKVTPPRKPIYRVSIGHKDAVSRMKAIGLIERKSLVLPPPMGLPEAVLPSFVRGFFDGNGFVALSRNPNVKSLNAPPRLISSITTSASWLQWLQDLLYQEVGIGYRKLVAKASIHAVQYNHGDSLKLASFMYGQVGPSLSRKRRIFAEGARFPWRGGLPLEWPLSL